MRTSPDVTLPRAYVLGGNSNTLAYVTSLDAAADSLSAHLVPLAMTPLGAVRGEGEQRATIPFSGLLDWIDTTFPPDDDRSFAAPARDIELLARIGWQAQKPPGIEDGFILNAEDLPDPIADAVLAPPAPLVQCASCRQLCVRDDFVWKERPLCAWDFHRQVFGKRGPWRTTAYEARHFESIPQAAYVFAPLLEEIGAQLVLVASNLDETVARELIGVVMRDDRRPHLAVRSPDGTYSLLRER